ncbi:MAG: hypothetical protein JEZ03_00310 [Bacteroidales bacterium]|nr:hypothetical protein [Bacteroidales bacterium]
MMKSIKYISSFIILFTLVFFSCNKKSPYQEFPDPGYFSFQIDPNSTMYQQLNVVGGYEYINVGYPSNGVIVYRINHNEFNAYERTCTYDPLERCPLIVQEFPLIADTCCDSRYIIYDGSPFDGPALYPLKKYRTHYSGGMLTISN